MEKQDHQGAIWLTKDLYFLMDSEGYMLVEEDDRGEVQTVYVTRENLKAMLLAWD